MFAAVVAGSFLMVGNASAALTSAQPPACGDTLVTIYDDCSGAWEGNSQGSPAQVADIINEIENVQGWGTVTNIINDFSGSGGTSGVLDLSSISGPFVIALKAGNAFSLYYQAGDGVANWAWDTLGVSLNKQGIPQDLSHTTIYSLVPEPETYAMLLAGLGLLGFSMRKQRV